MPGPLHQKSTSLDYKVSRKIKNLSNEERANLASGWSQTPAVQALAAQVKKGQEDAQLKDAKRIGQAYWAHRQAIDMGLYRLNYNYPYR